MSRPRGWVFSDLQNRRVNMREGDTPAETDEQREARVEATARDILQRAEAECRRLRWLIADLRGRDTSEMPKHERLAMEEHAKEAATELRNLESLLEDAAKANGLMLPRHVYRRAGGGYGVRMGRTVCGITVTVVGPKRSTIEKAAGDVTGMAAKLEKKAARVAAQNESA